MESSPLLLPKLLNCISVMKAGEIRNFETPEDSRGSPLVTISFENEIVGFQNDKAIMRMKSQHRI